MEISEELSADDIDYFGKKNLHYSGNNEKFYNIHKTSILNEYNAKKKFLSKLSMLDVKCVFERSSNTAIIMINPPKMSPIGIGEAVYLCRKEFPDNHHKGVIEKVTFLNDKVESCIMKFAEPFPLFLLKYSETNYFNLHYDIDRDQIKSMLSALKLFVVNKIDNNSLTQQRFPASIENIIINENDENNKLAVTPDIDTTLNIFNTLDNEQQEGVKKAICQTFSVLSGPPGCGKTKVLIGMMEQIYMSLQNDEKILLCAPTNLATDNLFKKGIMLAEEKNDHQSVRFYGKFVKNEQKIEKYDADSLMNSILQQNNYYKQLQNQLSDIQNKMTSFEVNQDMLNKLQSKKKTVARLILKQELECLKLIVKKAKIIGTTCALSSHSILRNLNFKIVIIDEAFCCMLPTLLEPLSKAKKHAILAYDSKQLGPLLYDENNVVFYDNNNVLSNIEHSNFSINLRKNYRLHKNVINIISNLFYLDQQIICMNPDNIDSKIIFVTNDEQEKKLNFSRYNEGDEQAVKKAIDILIEKNFQRNQIGIITFYKGALAKLIDKFENIEINTVDGFQGREKEAIIIVTTRNNAEKNIGFLENERRINVALTRASDFIVLIGNKDMLYENYNFLHILDRSAHY